MTLVTHLGQHSMRWYWPITLLYKPDSPNYGRHSSTLPSSVVHCPSIFLSAEVSPNSGVSSRWSVLGPKCLDTVDYARWWLVAMCNCLIMAISIALPYKVQLWTRWWWYLPKSFCQWCTRLFVGKYTDSWRCLSSWKWCHRSEWTTAKN